MTVEVIYIILACYIVGFIQGWCCLGIFLAFPNVVLRSIRGFMLGDPKRSRWFNLIYFFPC